MFTKPFYIFVLSLVAMLCASCSGDERRQLDEVEPLVITNADSLLSRLSQMPLPADPEQAARYQLLTVWAQYRRYDEHIDTLSLNQAFSYFHNSHDPLRRAQVYYLRSVVREDQKLGDAEEWTRDMLEASKSVERTSDHTLACQIYQRLASIMNSRHFAHEALAWGQKSCDEARLMGSVNEEVIALLNMAISHAWITDSIRESSGQDDIVYDESIRLSQYAVSIARQAGSANNEMRALFKLSSFYSRSQMPDSGLHYALLADELQTRLEANIPPHKRRGHQFLADAYRKMGLQYRAEYEKTHQPQLLVQSKAMADSVLRYARLDACNGDLSIRMTAAQLSYLTYLRLNIIADSALFYLNRMESLKDSLDRHQQSSQVLSLPLRMEKESVESKLLVTRHWLLWTILLVIVLAAGGTVFNVYMRRRYRHQVIEMQQMLNELIAQQRTHQPVAVEAPAAPAFVESVLADNEQHDDSSVAPTAEASLPVAPESQIVRLEGTTNESLSVAADHIIFATSEGNYLKVFYHNDTTGKFAVKLLRATMKQIETQLEPFSFIVRSHRAFLVNIKYVTRATHTSAGLALYMASVDKSIPVSRSCVERIRLALDQ